MYDRSDDYYEAKDKIAHLESLTAELAAMLGELEWNRESEYDPMRGTNEWYECPECGCTREYGHATTCRLSALLARAGGTKGAADER